MPKNLNNTRLIKTIGFVLISLLLIFLLVFLIYLKHKNQAKINLSSTSSNTEQALLPIDESYSLNIAEINIATPIIINVDGNNQEAYNKSLESGVAHLKGSSLPGKSGNPFIFGHSSYYPWKPGDYKEIFKDLDKLEIGDQIIISSNLFQYIYAVADKNIVSPDNVEVANQNFTENKLTLMTCWPIGSDAKRLIIVANLKETIAIQ